MLRIEKEFDGRVSRLRLSGRIQWDRIACIRASMHDDSSRKVLDQSEVTLVDVAVIHFLIGCEDEGIGLEKCPPYVREWISRERVEQSALLTTDKHSV